jgi:hypothetical protein
MGTIEKRIWALEAAKGNQLCPVAIFITFVAACDGWPDYSHQPNGWYFYANGQRVNIMLLPDETAEALQGRAAAAGRVTCGSRSGNYGVLLLPVESDGHANT